MVNLRLISYAILLYIVIGILSFVIGYKTLHLKASNKVIFMCTVLFYAKLQTLYKFIFDFFLVSRNLFEIGTLIPQFAARLRCKLFSRFPIATLSITTLLYLDTTILVYSIRRSESNGGEITLVSTLYLSLYISSM